MTSRPFGDTDLQVSRLCLGGNVFGWTADEPTSFAVLDAFVDGGGTFVDTADSYSAFAPGNSGGESETIIGRWLARRGSSSGVVIGTKVGQHPSFPGQAAPAVTAAVDASRQRLQVETVDLVLAHRDDPSVPLAETLGAYDALVAAGKIRYYGLSNFTAERAQEALDVARAEGLRLPVALQPHYNLMEREPYESTLAPLAARENLGVMPYFALASGFLTGKYTRGEAASGARGRSAETYGTEQGWAVVDLLRELAVETGTSPAAVALAWLADRPGVTSPIASASKPSQVPDLLAALDLELKPAQADRLTEVSAPA